jgi:hypothetical protein
MRTRWLLAVVLFAAPTLAQKRPEVGYQRTTRLDIAEDEVVDGATLSPGDAFVAARVRGRQPSMLPIRAHFLREMLRDAAERL